MPWEAKSNAQPTAAPQPPAVRISDPGVLAVVNGTAITQDVFRRRVEVLPEDNPSGFMAEFGSLRNVFRKPKTAEEKRILLEELVKEEQMVQDAVSLGLERDPDVRRQLDDSRRFILVAALTKRDADKAVVADDEVREFYQRYKDAYKIPERIRVRQIVTTTLDEAEAVRSHAVQGSDFAQLARERSIGPGKDEGGDIGWHVKAADHQLLTLTGQSPSEKTFFAQLEAVAFSLEVNQISQPVKGPDGHYYLIRLEDRTPQQIKSLSEVWDQLKAGLLMQKRQQALQDHLGRLSQKAKVEINEQRLESL